MKSAAEIEAEAEFYFEPIEGDQVQRGGIRVAYRGGTGQPKWVSLAGALDPLPPLEDDALVRGGKVVARAAAATALNPVRWVRFEEAPRPKDPNDAAEIGARMKTVLEMLAPVVLPPFKAIMEAARPPVAQPMPISQAWLHMADAALHGGVVAQEAVQAADFVMRQHALRFELPDGVECCSCGARATGEEAVTKGWVIIAIRSLSLVSRVAHFCSVAHVVSEDGRNAIAQLSLDARAER